MKHLNLYKKYIPEFIYRIINFGYNIYYKLSGKKILTQEDRYKLQELIYSNDEESIKLALCLLTDFYVGTDLVNDCSLRITYDDDKPEHLKHYFTFGKLQMNGNFKVQTVINEIKECIENNDFPSTIEYLRIIRYYFAYHPRIGGQTSLALLDAVHYPSPRISERLSINDRWHVYTWDWYRSKWAFPIKAEKYWQKHKKPGII